MAADEEPIKGRKFSDTVKNFTVGIEPSVGIIANLPELAFEPPLVDEKRFSALRQIPRICRHDNLCRHFQAVAKKKLLMGPDPMLDEYGLVDNWGIYELGADVRTIAVGARRAGSKVQYPAGRNSTER